MSSLVMAGYGTITASAHAADSRRDIGARSVSAIRPETSLSNRSGGDVLAARWYNHQGNRRERSGRTSRGSASARADRGLLPFMRRRSPVDKTRPPCNMLQRTNLHCFEIV